MTIAMEVALASAVNIPRAFGYRIVIPKSRKADPARSTHILSGRSSYCRCPLSYSFSLPNPKQFQALHKTMGSLNRSFESLQKFLPKQVKEFPWKKAEYKATQGLLFLGKEAIRWSLAIFLMLSPISDVVNAISRNKELIIPLGLSVGVIVAEFLKEISEELFRERNEEWDTRTRLLGIGMIFAFIKVALVFLKPPGQILLFHVCNGGLMQIFWLLKKLTETNNKTTERNDGLEAAT